MMDSETTFMCNQTQTSTPSPDPVSPIPSTPNHHPHHYGTVIPNRIFVGGIDFKTNENDLRRYFSQHGVVKEVKIVSDRAGVSRGYGFVTFETREDAQKILEDADRLCFKDKRLNIGQAVRKQHMGLHMNSCSSPSVALPTSGGTMYLTTSTGYPYLYHNGVAYFHNQDVNTPNHHWPPRSISSSPVMVTHQSTPVYPQPTFQHYQVPAQCVTGPLQWNMSQTPVQSSPMFYFQPSEVMYQPMELVADGGCVSPAVPILETAVPEQPCMDHMVQPAYHQMYSHSTAGLVPPFIAQDYGKEHRFHSIRRGLHHPPISLKSRYSRCPGHAHTRKDYRPEVCEPPPAQTTAEPFK